MGGQRGKSEEQPDMYVVLVQNECKMVGTFYLFSGVSRMTFDLFSCVFVFFLLLCFVSFLFIFLLDSIDNPANSPVCRLPEKSLVVM